MGRTHAIVGDGVVSAAFVATLDLRRGDRLVLIGPEIRSLGRGLAYADHPQGAPWKDAYLLNSPAGAVDPAFPAWLAQRWQSVIVRMAGHPRWLNFNADALEAEDIEALFLPRAIFGDYVAHRAWGIIQGIENAGVEISFRVQIVTDIHKEKGKFVLILSDGTQVVADAVDVATGGPASRRFGVDTGPTAFDRLYGNEAALHEVITPGNEVLCIGANAAMLDVLRFLQSILPESEIRMAALSPSGHLPEPLIWTRPRRPEITPALTGPFDASEFFCSVDSDLARHCAQGARMAELRRGYRTFLKAPKLAHLIPDPAERRKIAVPLERRFRRGTHDSLADFDRLRAAGQIRIIRGTADYIVAGDLGHNRLRINGPSGRMDLDADVVINCAGPDPAAFEFMTADLLRKGWIAQTPEGGLHVHANLETEVPGLRYLSPAVTEIGADILALPLYDAGELMRHVHNASVDHGN